MTFGRWGNPPKKQETKKVDCNDPVEFDKKVAEAVARAKVEEVEKAKWDEIRKEYPKEEYTDVKPPYELNDGTTLVQVYPGDWIVEDGVIYEVLAAKFYQKTHAQPDDPEYYSRHQQDISSTKVKVKTITEPSVTGWKEYNRTYNYIYYTGYGSGSHVLQGYHPNRVFVVVHKTHAPKVGKLDNS